MQTGELEMMMVVDGAGAGGDALASCSVPGIGVQANGSQVKRIALLFFFWRSVILLQLRMWFKNVRVATGIVLV